MDILRWKGDPNVPGAIAKLSRMGLHGSLLRIVCGRPLGAAS